MRILITLALALAVLGVACGGSGDDDVDELEQLLADVCTETDEVAGEDVIKIDTPSPGDRVEAPFHTAGEVAIFQEMFWVTVIKADGERVIDYPVKIHVDDATPDGQTLLPYEADIAFYIEEDTPACLWVYRRLVEEPEDAVRIPVVLIPSDAAE